MFAKPEVGKTVTVRTDWKDHVATSTPIVQIKSRFHTTTGKVLPSESYDDPETFRITTGKPYFPVAVISLPRVVELDYIDGSKASTKAKQSPQPEAETWNVEGSKGNTYVVTRKGEQWSCTCAGFGFRRYCKHMNAKKAEVLDRL